MPRERENEYGLLIAAIVAIVSIVGLVILFSPRMPQQQMGQWFHEGWFGDPDPDPKAPPKRQGICVGKEGKQSCISGSVYGCMKDPVATFGDITRRRVDNPVYQLLPSACNGCGCESLGNFGMSFKCNECPPNNLKLLPQGIPIPTPPR